MKISLVMPCRNEGGHLQEVVNSVSNSVTDIILVNNLSTDGTPDEIQSIAVHNPKVVFLNEDREVYGCGYGYALLSGMQRAQGDFIICADADATYPLADVDKLVTYLADSKADVVFCERRTEVSRGWAMGSRVGTYLLNLQAWLLFGYKIKDMTSGMWAIRRQAFEKIRLKEGGWDFSLEIKIESHQKSLSVLEYPIDLDYRSGYSKQFYVKTGFRHAWWLLKRRFVN